MLQENFNVLATMYTIPRCKEQLREFANLTILERPEREEILEAISEMDAVLAGGGTKFDEELFQAAEGRLKVVARVGVGYDNVDVDAATKYGVMATNTPGVMAESVSEHTILLMLAAAKDIVRADQETREGNWWGWEEFRGTELWGKSLGQIGLGRIGYMVADKAKKAFNMDLMVYDPYVDEERILKVGGKYVELDELLRKSDVVAINCPLTDETHQLIGERELKLMQKGAMLVNTGRGPIVNESALIDALKRGTIARAGLDVFEQEPISEGNPLREMDNVVLTPHQGSNTTTGVNAMFREAVRNVRQALEGKRPKFLINTSVYEG